MALATFLKPAILGAAGKTMGHAGAIISGGKGTAAAKVEALEEAGIEVAQSPADMGEAVQRAMNGA